MDTITHVVLGAVTGELTAGKELGRKAMAWGALAQVSADIDVIAALWLSPADNVIFHRGITHSLLFNILLAVALALVIVKKQKAYDRPFLFWLRFLLIQFSLHLFVDVFNAYGIGFFEPFTKVKYSFNSLFVVDPIFTLPLIVASIILIFETRIQRRVRWAVTGISISGVYLISAVFFHYTISERAESKLKDENIPYQRLLVTPTPMNTWLWFIAAEQDNGYHLNYYSIFQEENHDPFHYIPKGKQFIPRVNDKVTLRKLTDFSNGYYIIEKAADTLVLNDLRFGQITGWMDPAAPFAFHFYLDGKGDNTYVMQRGRVLNWNSETIEVLLDKTFAGD